MMAGHPFHGEQCVITTTTAVTTTPEHKIHTMMAGHTFHGKQCVTTITTTTVTTTPEHKIHTMMAGHTFHGEQCVTTTTTNNNNTNTQDPYSGGGGGGGVGVGGTRYIQRVITATTTTTTTTNNNNITTILTSLPSPTQKIRTVVAGDPFHGVQRVPQPLLPVQHVPRRVGLAGPRAVLGGPGDPSFRRPLVPLVLSRQHASGDMGQRPWRGYLFSL